MPINWYPGHMAKTVKQLAERVSQVDAVLEVVDARLPLSSRNPDVSCIFEKKPLILVLNKCDLADFAVTEKWVDYFTYNNIKSVKVCASSGYGFGELKSIVLQSVRQRLELNEKRGMYGRTIRIIIVGIPNVGKSMLINKFVGKKSASVENHPGVTKSIQWLPSRDGAFSLVDTPGILWPKFDDQAVAEKLAFLGTIKDDLVDIEDLAAKFCSFLLSEYPEITSERYGISCRSIIDKYPESERAYVLLSEIAKKRCFISRGNQLDFGKTAYVVLNEFRNCKIGRISLETP